MDDMVRSAPDDSQGRLAREVWRFAQCAAILVSSMPVVTAGSLSWEWERWPDLPAAHGLKGMYSGTCGSRLVVAGGSYFSEEAHGSAEKRFSDRIYVASMSDPKKGVWHECDVRLPGKLAEGASVETRYGIVGIGGRDSAGCRRETFLLRWDDRTHSMELHPLPEFPEALASCAAACLNGALYVAGGENADGATSKVWRLDLALAVKDDATPWTEVAPIPGPPRSGAVLSRLWGGSGETLFVFGGRTRTTNRSVQSDYLNDCYAYDLAADSWRPVASMPHAAFLAGGARLFDSGMAILGGSDGHDLERIKELGASYRIPAWIQVYDAKTNAWSLGGEMPLGLAAPAIIEAREGWLIVGGEYSPGLRSAHVHLLRRLDGCRDTTPES